MARTYRKPLIYDWRKRTRPGLNGCLLWKGTLNAHGYGTLVTQGKMWNAHRYIYTQTRGPLEPGERLHKACDTLGCVHPDHWVVHKHNPPLARIKRMTCLAPAPIHEPLPDDPPPRIIRRRPLQGPPASPD